MQPATMVLIYVIVWWVLFFMALPIGLKGGGVNPQTGAPQIPKLRIKAIVVSGIALVISAAIIWFLLTFGAGFYDWAASRG